MRVDTDWSAYAEVYDLMAENNPAYQSLISQVTEKLRTLELSDGEILLDLGAGTGNFSTVMGTLFPQGRVLHFDRDPVMNQAARAKAESLKLANFEILTNAIEEASFAESSISVVVCVHALYTLKNPGQTLESIFRWLRPGGHILICDIGKELDLWDWSKYLFSECFRAQGLVSAISLFWNGRRVVEQNRTIARLQKEGTYWTHSLEEFRLACTNAGFCVKESVSTYRNYSNVVFGIKP